MRKTDVLKTSIFNVKKTCLQVSFWSAPTHADIIEFSSFLLQPKNQRSASKTVWLFYYFNFERNYDLLKSKRPCFLLNKNINFNKNEKQNRKWKISHTVLERCTFNSYKNRKLKLKLWWAWVHERKEIFFTICVLSQYSVLNTLSEYTYF